MFLLCLSSLIQYYVCEILPYCRYRFSFSSLIFWPCRVAWEILAPQPGIAPVPSSLKTLSLYHWPTREGADIGFLIFLNNLMICNKSLFCCHRIFCYMIVPQFIHPAFDGVWAGFRFWLLMLL